MSKQPCDGLARWVRRRPARAAVFIILAAVLSLPFLESGAVMAAPSILTLSAATGGPGTQATLMGRIDTSLGGYAVRWNTAPTVPRSGPGSHTVSAYSATNPQSNVDEAPFALARPQVIISPNSGQVGATVTVSGDGFAPSETGIQVAFDGMTVRSGIAAGTNGRWQASIQVPESTSGISHIIGAYGAITSASDVTGQVFTINPSISISPDTGSVGVTIMVSGNGFLKNERGIEVAYDELTVISDISASDNGSWARTFLVPLGATGTHAIRAQGLYTPAGRVSPVTLSISPRINISPSSRPAGATVTVNGTGFAPNESGIAVSFGKSAVSKSVAADEYGRWSTSFPVPTGPGGVQPVAAYGPITPAKDVPRLTFTIAPMLKISPETGPVGTKLTVSGAGFTSGEKGINITYDGQPVEANVTADANGEWKATIAAPPSGALGHAISANSKDTPAAIVPSAEFNIVASMTMKPDTGYAGMPVTVTGTGFAANRAVAVTYDGVPVTTNPNPLVADARGNFTGTFAVPRVRGGRYNVHVSNGTDSRDAEFSVDSSPPPAPRTSAPEQGVRIGLFGGDSVTFEWTPVEAPSGIHYVLQVFTRPDLAVPILNKQELTTNRYTTGPSEKLPVGVYYWRVKAVDNAFNESTWTPAVQFNVGYIPLWILASLASVVVLILVAILLPVAKPRRPPRLEGVKDWSKRE